MKLNELQNLYIQRKAAYEAAAEVGNWDLVEKLEDDYIQSEFDLVKWGLDQAVEMNRMSQEDAEMVFRNMPIDKFHEMAEKTARVVL